MRRCCKIKIWVRPAVPCARLHDRLACLYNFIYGFFLLRVCCCCCCYYCSCALKNYHWHSSCRLYAYRALCRYAKTWSTFIRIGRASTSLWILPTNLLVFFFLAAAATTSLHFLSSRLRSFFFFFFFFFFLPLLSSCVYELMILNCLCAYIQLLGTNVWSRYVDLFQ